MFHECMQKSYRFLVLCTILLLVSFPGHTYQQDVVSDGGCTVLTTSKDPSTTINNKILKCRNITSASINSKFSRSRDVTYGEVDLRYIVLKPDQDLNVINENQTETFKLTDSYVTDDQINQYFHRKNFARLLTLDISGNNLQQLDRNTFRKSSRLRSVNLSRNQLQDLPRNVFDDLTDLSELNLSNNKIKDFAKNPEIFDYLRQLKTLDLSNNSITNIVRQMFQGLQNLQVINLAYNQLHVLPYHVFEQLQSIEEIDLSNNRIVSVENSFFLHNIRLKTLNLRHNRIHKIDDNSFYGLRELRNLDLSFNDLWNIKQNAFDTLDDLENLNLDHNRIDLLSANIFISLKKLKSLDLSDNNIQLLPFGIFAHQFKLEMLRMDNTKLVKLSNWISTTNTNVTINPTVLMSLRHVSLGNSTYIRDIESSFLRNLPNVETLTITHSQISFLPLGIDAMSNLIDLDLSNNRLEYIPSGIKHLSKLNSLNLLGNNLQCDCQMYWMNSWIDELNAKNKTLPHEMLRLSELKCAHGYPGDIIRVLRHINCMRPFLIFSTKEQTYGIGTDAVLECSFAGNPAPQIIWQTPIGQILRFDESKSNDINAKFQLEQSHQSVLKDAHALEKFQQIVDSEMKSENLSDRVRQAHGITLLEKGYLRVHNISRHDAGLYSCFAVNIMGNATTDVR